MFEFNGEKMGSITTCEVVMLTRDCPISVPV